MKQQDHIQLLKKIKQVDAPNFLYTRIEAKINQLQQNYTPLKWVAVSTTAFCLLFILNFTAINRHYANQANEQTMQSLVEKMNLITTNQLYYE